MINGGCINTVPQTSIRSDIYVMDGLESEFSKYMKINKIHRSELQVYISYRP
ncbi:hypothetical protein Sjap_012058 [Stephania japonica]|uniref:Uncharacterized protein n=1 Tax=Stephania japonica TaxID=461633 RepID=A0AAP0JCG3_9MAGN